MKDKILCFFLGHKWGKIKNHFYCEKISPFKFRKLWQVEKRCLRCGKKVVPDWFDSSWREIHPPKFFFSAEKALNLTFEESKAWDKTIKRFKLF